MKAIELKSIYPYTDEYGNSIEYEGIAITVKRILFRGRNNKLKVAKSANITFLDAYFPCNNACVEIAAYGNVQVTMQIGEDSKISIGRSCFFTAPSNMTLAEGTNIQLGEYCMISPGVTFRTHDHHPIFFVASGTRANPSKSIFIGNHVWIGERAFIGKGSDIHDGSVIGYGSVVFGIIQNNCIAAGIPAKIIKKDIAWEFPHLNGNEPYYKPDASCVNKSFFWNMTEPVADEDFTGDEEQGFLRKIQVLTSKYNPLKLLHLLGGGGSSPNFAQ